MFKRKIIKKIKQLKKTSVDGQWLKKGEGLLSNYIEENPVRIIVSDRPGNSEDIFNLNIFKKLILKPMPIAIIAIVIALITGGGAVNASQNSLPADVLYPVKLAVENAQEGLTFNKADKMNLEVKFAERRLAEVKKVQEKGDSKKVIEPTLAKYKQHIVNAQNYLSQLDSSEKSAKIIALALKLESAIERQQAILDAITSQSPPEYGQIFAWAKKESLNQSTVSLEKIKDKLNQIKEDEAKDVEEGKIETTTSTEAYFPNLIEKAKKRIEVAENKLLEIRKKIDKLEDGKENKCSVEEKKKYVSILESQYEEMKAAIDSARQLFNEGNYINALTKANQIFAIVVDFDNLNGQWNSRCGEAEEDIANPVEPNDQEEPAITPGEPDSQDIYLGQKFDLLVGQQVSIADYLGVEIVLAKIYPVMCKQEPCSDVAVLKITFPNKCASGVSKCVGNSAKEIQLISGQTKEINGDIKITLIGLSDKTATLLVDRNSNNACPPPLKCVDLYSPGNDKNGCPIYKCGNNI